MDHLLQTRTRVREAIIETPLVASLMAGRISRDAYADYLCNVYAYAEHSAKVIALAASRCMNSHPELARYLLHHAEEEQGHDRWALADLADLGYSEVQVNAVDPVPSCSAMIGFEYFIAGYANPVGLFGWLYVLEAMGDDLGSEVAAKVDEALALGGQGLRFIAGHGVADVEHTADITAQIGAHLTAPADLRAVTHVAEVIATLYVGMFREIGARAG
jgi:heme oxygenase